MRRPAWYGAVLTGVCWALIGCGDSSPPSPEATPPTVDLGEAATAAPPADMTPVLPIPDDLPAADATPVTPDIKPIPDEEPAAPKS